MLEIRCIKCNKTSEYPDNSYVPTQGYGTLWECPKCKRLSPNPLMSDDTPRRDDGCTDYIKTSAHPLLNPDSPHYRMVDDVEAIERMEQMYSTKDLMAWAKITAMKYRLRIGNKDNVLKEAEKIKGYEAYYKYLKAKRK